MVKLLFKTPSKEQPFELEIDVAVVTNVEQLKQKVADHTNSTVPNIKLIHKGTNLCIYIIFETYTIDSGLTLQLDLVS